MERVERASLRQVREAREVFRQLLSTRAAEPEWQRFFAEHPFVLSRGLPLRLAPRQIIPLARPGKSEPDFVFFQKTHGRLTAYGVIELKTPRSRVLTRPRRDIVLLTRQADTAVKQAQKYADSILLPEEVLVIGAPLHLFVIMGLSTEIVSALAEQTIATQLSALVPRGCEILGYDELLRRFEATLPEDIIVLVPARLGEFERFCQVREIVRHVRPAFLRVGGEYEPFFAFHALQNSCPACHQRALYCCFSGPLGGGSSIVEEFLHVCVRCTFNEFKSTWYSYDGSDWADCVCLMCKHDYGSRLARADEVRIRDLAG